MRKLIFIIAVCMLYHNAYGAGEICSNPCLEGTFPVPYDREACEVCPANTYTDERLCHSGMSPTCKPCPAGTGTIGDTAADHDSIDDCIPMETEEISCNPGYYLPANSQSCTQCPKNSYCPGGTFTETTSDSGITQCPDNMYSPLGSDSADDCGMSRLATRYITVICSPRKIHSKLTTHVARHTAGLINNISQTVVHK